ncbi:hypothetical protein D9757_003664 [Collybiopsis confluens]|uniref:Aminoglycoside phosphotransferase domain-containing protein n=1 Tax=Collybiopsis confluens TaxID=2823264 RepID=A0A8H5HV08_9AGAR|nr:hypothetical protein D9757_003664 [Collybiopsis confluens]
MISSTTHQVAGSSTGTYALQNGSASSRPMSSVPSQRAPLRNGSPNSIPRHCPKFYAIASEVATCSSSGLPVLEVYGYSPSSDNTAKTEYIFMEISRGSILSEVWPELEEPNLASVLRELVQLESRMMSIAFPAGGSLYYTKDLVKATGKKGIPLNSDKRFCLGPDARLRMWYGRRSQLDVDRGPYGSVEAALLASARKELAYLEQFGRPPLPFQRERRETYEFKEQSPLDYVKKYRTLPSHGILAHSSQLKIVGLLDWQHASILPAFLMASIPGRLQNYDDPVSQYLIPPSLPANMDELDESEQIQAMELYHRRLVTT